MEAVLETTIAAGKAMVDAYGARAAAALAAAKLAMAEVQAAFDTMRH
jgi:hypothetical protein